MCDETVFEPESLLDVEGAVVRSEIVSVDLTGVTSDRNLLDLYISTMARSSPGTKKKYSSAVSSLLSYLEKLGLGLNSMRLDTLVAYMQHIQVTKKPKAAHDTLVIVKVFLNWASRVGYLMFNVGSAIKLAQYQDKRSQRILTEEQVRDLISHSEGMTRIMIMMLYGSAMRISELCDLRWRDIHWLPGELCAVTLETPKGGASRQGVSRTIPVPTTYLRALHDLEGWQNGSPDRDARVFTHSGGKPLNRFYASKLIKKVVREAGLPESTSPHWLRHAHATHARAHGAKPDLVQMQLGHKDPKTTAFYTHINPTEGSGTALPDLHNK